MSSDERSTRGETAVGGESATEPIRLEYDRTSPDSLSVAIVRGVSAVTGQQPTAMAPLYSTVDSDALERLVHTSRGDSPRLSFSYEGCRVRIERRGEVVIESAG